MNHILLCQAGVIHFIPAVKQNSAMQVYTIIGCRQDRPREPLAGERTGGDAAARKG